MGMSRPSLLMESTDSMILTLVALSLDIENVVDVNSLLATKTAKATSFLFYFHSTYYRSD